ncbi:hypothetical protein [Halobacteriovorax sp. HLS]|uniref:hypothetical protein n=1 Tax=Halobacteriovorax sp. HLS TaxID=2234000 RepID=UPI000FD80E57|nr:hypothetical protein [Halobacteriovorax sp. HLS]
MTKSFSLVQMIIILFILSSCGVKKNSSLQSSESEAIMSASKSMQNCSQVNSSVLVKEAKNIIMTAERMIQRSGRQYLLPIQNINMGNSNLLSPLLVGRELIESLIQDLQEEINKSQSINTVSTTEVNWIELIKKRNALERVVTRWSFHQCHLGDLVRNNNEEIKDFLTLESQFCKEDCVRVSDGRIIEKDSIEIRNKAIRMCTLVKAAALCEIEYDFFAIKNKRNSYIRDLLKVVRKKYNSVLFEPKGVSLPLNCSKSGKKVFLKVPYKEGTVDVLSRKAIKKYWDNQNFQIEFVSSAKGFSIKKSNSRVSMVSDDSGPTIFLSNSLRGELEVKTVAHEFGHILGFRDCYIEYYDARNEEIVYFELERESGNLMCTLDLGDNIPQKYRNSLIKKYCD